jgi:hypothetical protein
MLTVFHSRLDSVISKLALGTDRINAKLAARYLSNSRGRDKHAAAIIEVCSHHYYGFWHRLYHVQKLYKLLANADDVHTAAHITALSEFALYSSDHFEERSEDIVRFLVQDLVYREVDKVRTIAFDSGTLNNEIG